MSLLALGSQLAPAFPPSRGSGTYGVRSPITVAGPRRIRTDILGPSSPCRRPSSHQPAARSFGLMSVRARRGRLGRAFPAAVTAGRHHDEQTHHDRPGDHPAGGPHRPAR